MTQQFQFGDRVTHPVYGEGIFHAWPNERRTTMVGECYVAFAKGSYIILPVHELQRVTNAGQQGEVDNLLRFCEDCEANPAMVAFNVWREDALAHLQAIRAQAQALAEAKQEADHWRLEHDHEAGAHALTKRALEQQLATAQGEITEKNHDIECMAKKLGIERTHSEQATAEAKRLREALAELRQYFESLAQETELGYGYFPGGDPRTFSPDPECSTESERAKHRRDCAKAEIGAYVEVGGYGLGTYKMPKYDGVEGLRVIDAALQQEVAE